MTFLGLQLVKFHPPNLEANKAEVTSKEIIVSVSIGRVEMQNGIGGSECI